MKHLTLVIILLALPGCASTSPRQSEAVQKAAERRLTCSDTLKAETTTHTNADPVQNIAMVNGKPITTQQFDAELRKFTSRKPSVAGLGLPQVKQAILRQLIEKELLDQAMAAAGVTVTEATVDQALATYKAGFHGEDDFANYMEHGGVTLGFICQGLRDKVSVKGLLDAQGTSAVSDQDVRDFYAQNSAERDAVRASHILVKVARGASEGQLQSAQAKIEKIVSELNAGLSFAEAAQRFSEGPSSLKGGDLGFFPKGRMVKSFELVAFALSKGAVSGAVRTRFGLHLIKVTDIRLAPVKPLKAVEAQIRLTLEKQQRSKLMSDLRSTAKIEKLSDFSTP